MTGLSEFSISEFSIREFKQKAGAAIVTAIVLGSLLGGCDNGGPIDGGDVGQVDEYFDSLPSWSAVVPPVSETPPTATDAPEPDPNEPEVVVDVETYDDDGDPVIAEDVVYVCNVTPYTLSDNPEDIVIFSPDRDVLYPGAMIQGRTHADPIGSLRGLNIPQRSSVRISIPDLPGGETFRDVQPGQAEVDDAIRDMVTGAELTGLDTPSKIFFELEEYHSEEQFALQVGLSGKYLNFSGSASGSTERSASETTLSAYFVQSMFDVVYQAPLAPEDFFTSEFTADRMQRLVDDGLIGPDNLPVYVSTVTYGRMMMFTITSTASEEELRATVQAAYNGIGTSVEISMTAKQRKILSQSKIRIASYGGNAQATLDIIQSGDWSQYFTSNAALTTALPMSYVMKNVGDGSIASVGETTNYEIKECLARGTAGETFSFRTAQDFALPVSAPAELLQGDFNGDGQEDLLWNHKTSGVTNEVAVGFSNGDGTFSIGAPDAHPLATVYEGWGSYETLVGDFDNDGRDDVAFSIHRDTNAVYVGLSNADGTFNFLDRHTVPQTLGWDGYKVRVADIDGVNGDDIIFNNVSSTSNWTHFIFSNGDGTFTDNVAQRFGTSGGWQDYTVHVANVDGDADDDIVWSALRSSENAMYFARSKGTQNGNVFDAGSSNRSQNGWRFYDLTIGNIDGRLGDDVVFTNSRDTSGPVPIHRNVALGNGAYTQPSFQNWPRPEGFEGGLDTYLADVNGDGQDDLIFGKRGVVNRIGVSLGKSDATFDVMGRAPQAHPDIDDWSIFDTLFLDVDNDGDEDVLWINNAASLRIYVGLAR